MKPFYSIRELAELLDEETYRVADGLVACGIPAIFMGKEIVLAEYECFQPPRLGNSITVFTSDRDRPAEPTPDNVVVSTEKFPESWINVIAPPKTNTAPSNDEKPLKATERNTLLILIAALCDYSDINHQERGAASQIAKFTEEIGATVSHDAVKRHLDSIPEALERRMK